MDDEKNNADGINKIILKNSDIFNTKSLFKVTKDMGLKTD